MPESVENVRDLASLVPMRDLLAALGFTVNPRTRRCACILHLGNNQSAFSWTEEGLWKCHSCGAGGDRIALVQITRQCGFREAVEFLAALGGVEYRARRISREDLARMRARRARTESSAWAIHDAVIQLVSGYARALRLVERLQRAIGAHLKAEPEGSHAEALWAMLTQLAPIGTYFLAAFDFLGHANAETRIRFVLGTPAERRAFIFGDRHAE